MDKKDYKQYKLEDFVTDDEFKRWVLNRDSQLDQFWKKWVDAHPEKKASVQKAREMLLRLKFNHHKVEETEKETVLRHVLKGDKSTRFDEISHAQDRPEFHLSQRWWLRVAASVLLVACIFLFNRLDQGSHPPTETVEATQIITRSLPKGQKLTMMLPDGSRVHLNAESSITFPEQFDGKIRTVELRGEAYFDVVKNEHQPFIVRTGQISTVVLGTSFNISSFPEQKEISVSLVSGKVRVQLEQENQDKIREVMLIEGEKVSIDKNSSATVKSMFDVAAEAGWKDGLLVFEEDNYKTVMAKLERWYGVEFIANNKPAGKWKIKGRFNNLSLEEVLENLKYTHKIDYKIIDKTVYLNF